MLCILRKYTQSSLFKACRNNWLQVQGHCFYCYLITVRLILSQYLVTCFLKWHFLGDFGE